MTCDTDDGWHDKGEVLQRTVGGDMCGSLSTGQAVTTTTSKYIQELPRQVRTLLNHRLKLGLRPPMFPPQNFQKIYTELSFIHSRHNFGQILACLRRTCLKPRTAITADTTRRREAGTANPIDIAKGIKPHTTNSTDITKRTKPGTANSIDITKCIKPRTAISIAIATRIKPRTADSTDIAKRMKPRTANFVYVTKRV